MREENSRSYMRCTEPSGYEEDDQRTLGGGQGVAGYRRHPRFSPTRASNVAYYTMTETRSESIAKVFRRRRRRHLGFTAALLRFHRTLALGLGLSVGLSACVTTLAPAENPFAYADDHIRVGVTTKADFTQLVEWKRPQKFNDDELWVYEGTAKTKRWGLVVPAPADADPSCDGNHFCGGGKVIRQFLAIEFNDDDTVKSWDIRPFGMCTKTEICYEGDAEITVRGQLIRRDPPPR